MIVNQDNLRSLYTGYNTSYQSGFTGVKSQYQQIATTIKSTTKSNEYGWLGKMRSMREWIGDRVINGIATHGYTIKNKSYENTIGVDREDIEDDNIGIYATLFQDLGHTAAIFPDKLVFNLLKNGFSTPCYDGQYFFDTDHPVLDENGVEYSVSNTGGGSGTPWFLLDVTRPLKPIIYQERKPFNKLVKKDQDTDDNVFFRKEFIYGTDGRCNVGFGHWQQAFGSKQPLTAENYAAARAAMGSFKADHGEPLGVKGTLLVVPPTLEGAARKILENAMAAGGESNEWAKTAEIMVSPWLA